MVNSAEFAKRLGEILEYYGISAAAFSEMVTVNRSTISHLLSGRNKPSLEFVLKVLKVFPEVELYWLLNGEGHFPTPSKIQKTESPEVMVSKNNTGVDSIESQRKNTSLLDSVQNEEPKLHTTKSIQPSTGHSEDLDFGTIERIVVFYKNGRFKTYMP